MSGAADDQVNKSMVNITVLGVTPTRAGRLFALASVEIDIGGVGLNCAAFAHCGSGRKAPGSSYRNFALRPGSSAPSSPCPPKSTSRSATRCSTRWSSTA
jgi:hypothetical protein